MSAKSVALETTAESFDRDVFEASMEKIVILDFYADWCQPCRMLAPVLQDVVNARSEQFALVKANTEKLPEQASAFEVQSIPVLFAITSKSVIDRVEGLLTQAQLNQWFDSLLIQQKFLSAYSLEETDPAAALSLYEQIAASGNVADELKIAILRTHFKLGDHEAATKMLAELERRGFLEPEAERLKSQLKLSHTSKVDVEGLKQTVADSPADHASRLTLAQALVANGQYEAALQHALEIVQRDRTTHRKAAQELMIDIFRVLPDGDELIGVYRRKLAMAMY
jgi:putative thioredoxin